MSAQITVTLPEDVLERAEVLARRTGQPVSDLLAETISLSLKPLGTARGQTEDLGAKSNEEVLAASQTEMPPAGNIGPSISRGARTARRSWGQRRAAARR